MIGCQTITSGLSSVSGLSNCLLLASSTTPGSLDDNQTSMQRRDGSKGFRERRLAVMGVGRGGERCETEAARRDDKVREGALRSQLS